MDFLPDDTRPTATDAEIAEATQYNGAVAILRGNVLGQTRVGSPDFRMAYEEAAVKLRAPVPVCDLVEEAASLATLASLLYPMASESAFRNELYAYRRDVLGRALTDVECDRLSEYAHAVWTARTERVA